MTKPHDPFPNRNCRPYLSDGGLETTLFFVEGVELPCFAAFLMLDQPGGMQWLRDYYHRYIDLAESHGTGFVLESVTWRASQDWGDQLGYDEAAMDRVNRTSIGLLHEIREQRESPTTQMPVSGCLGPRGDGYSGEAAMSADEAAEYHLPQIRSLRDGGADLVTAMTIPSMREAHGIAEAASALSVPSVISFTVETDGRLPDGTSLDEAIAWLDAETSAPPVHYMLNCAHPTHFADQLASGNSWTRRIGGLRANASSLSHAELDESSELDTGDPADLASRYRALLEQMPQLHVLGGCCGTDERHLAAIAEACLR